MDTLNAKDAVIWIDDTCREAGPVDASECVSDPVVINNGQRQRLDVPLHNGKSQSPRLLTVQRESDLLPRMKQIHGVNFTVLERSFFLRRGCGYCFGCSSSGLLSCCFRGSWHG